MPDPVGGKLAVPPSAGGAGEVMVEQAVVGCDPLVSQSPGGAPFAPQQSPYPYHEPTIPRFVCWT
jgi:hypothetical protein